MFNAILFDLDGTLLNTLDDLTTAVGLAMADMGLAPRTRDDVRRFVGSGAEPLCRRCLGDGASDEQVRTLISRFQAHYKRHLHDKTAPYPGVVDMLKALRERHIATGVVSNKFSEASQQVVKDYFGPLIDVTVGQQEGVAIKPAPDTLIRAMSLLGVKPEGCAMVGDSPQDIQAAINAACTGIGVTWGFRSAEELKAAGAVHLIDEPMALLAMPGCAPSARP